MSEYYDHTGFPSKRSAGLSASMRAELIKIETGFGKLPTLTGNANKIVVVNSAGTGLTSVASLVSPLIQAPTISAPTITGLVTLSDGQIKFPATQVSSADVNTLDDYEEGTWTPSIGGTATYTTQVGRYVKIGKSVHVSFRLVINTRGTGSQTVISGLPFTTANISASFILAIGSTGALVASVVSIAAVCASNGTTITLYSRTAAATSDGINNVIGNGTEINASGWYESNEI